MKTSSIPAPFAYIPLANLLPRERRVIRNMASALHAAFQITEGRELVIYLGLGGERSNLEALETWVCQQMLANHRSPSQDNLGWYVNRLEITLNTLMEELA